MQDGGLLINNPTALAVHESKCLWPSAPLECVVSVGTGRVENLGKNSTTSTSLKTKLTHVISSATDTEGERRLGSAADRSSSSCFLRRYRGQTEVTKAGVILKLCFVPPASRNWVLMSPACKTLRRGSTLFWIGPTVGLCGGSCSLLLITSGHGHLC